MKKNIAIFLFFLLLVLLQISVLPNFFKMEAMPNLMLVVLIFFSVRKGFNAIWKKAVLAGFLLDIFCFLPLGTNVITYVFLVLLCSYLGKRFMFSESAWSLPVLIGLLVAGTFISELLVDLILKAAAILSVHEQNGSLASLKAVHFKAMNNIILFFIIYWPLKKLEKFSFVFGQEMLTVKRQ